MVSDWPHFNFGETCFQDQHTTKRAEFFTRFPLGYTIPGRNVVAFEQPPIILQNESVNLENGEKGEQQQKLGLINK